MGRQRLFTAPLSVEFIRIEREEAKKLETSRYFDGSSCRKKHISEKYVSTGRCCKCKIENHKKRYEKERDNILRKQAEWKAENKKKIQEWGKEYRALNSEEIKRKKSEDHKRKYKDIKSRRATYFEKNREKILKNKREYTEKNKKEINKKRRDSHKVRIKNDIEYIKNRKARTFLRSCIERIGKKDSDSKISEQIGYRSKDLVKHISSLFVDGMSWDNYGEWHIDHIKPVSLFVKEGEYNPKVINALDNLQPLWADENRKKAAKYEKQNPELA